LLQRRSGLRIVIVLFGILGVLIGYYWQHKLLPPAMIVSLGGMVVDFFTAASLAIIGGGLGRRLLSRLNLSILSRPERIALEGMFGLGLISLVALLLGLIGLFKGVILWPVLLISGLVMWRTTLSWLAEFYAVLIRFFQPTTRWGVFLTVLLSLTLIGALLHALVPPYAWDGLLYHLVAPTKYVAAERIIADPQNPFMGFPENTEMLYGIAYSLLGRDTALAPLHWIFGVFTLLLTGGLAKRYTSVETGLLAALLLSSAFSVWLLIGQPYVDVAMMAYGILSLVLVLAWRETSDSRWLIVIGLCGGLALGVKYTAIALLGASLFFVVCSAPKQLIRNGLIIGGCAFLTFLPWMIRNALLYYNPLYPYLIDGLSWDSIRAAGYNTVGGGLLGSENGWQLLILPLAVTIFGVEKGVSFSFTAGPWLLTLPLLLPLGYPWLNQPARQLVKNALLFSLPIFVFWVLLVGFTGIGVQTRLMTMILPLSALFAGLAFYSISKWPRIPLDLHFVVRIILGITLLFEVVGIVRSVVEENFVGYAMATIDHDNFLTEKLGAYIDTMRYLGTLPLDSRVRMMWEPRSYYCPVNCLPDTLIDHWSYPLKKGQTPDEIFQGWHTASEDYLLLFNAGFEFTRNYMTFPGVQDFQPALERWMEPVWTNNAGYTLYKWKAELPQ
jgi:hypothetical protein